jgi:hypothetical protein
MENNNIPDPDPIAPPPSLVDPPPADNPPPADPKPTDPPKEGGDPKPADPPAFNLEEYLSGVKVDEGKTYEFDQDLLKEVAPVANELGIKPEALGKLANLLATRQSADLAKAAEERTAYNQRQTEYVKQLDAAANALREANPQFDAHVKAALELPFVKGSEFANVLKETHLSHDPVVLQLLEIVGRTHASDDGLGVNTPAPNGGGNATVAEIFTGGLYK